MAALAEMFLYGVVLAAQPGAAGGEPAAVPLLEERQAAARDSPTDPRVRMELGLAYLRAGEYELAMAELVEAIQLNPENKDNLAALANYHLGTALLALDRPALAMDALRESLRLGWKDAGVYLALGQALTGQGKFDEAIVQYREALRLAPATADAYAGLGLALEAAGRVDEAMANYERYLQSAPAPDDHGADAIRRRLAKLKERRKM